MAKMELFENPPNVKATVAEDVTVVSQIFERGVMHWFAPEEDGANGTIFALMDVTGQWWRGEDFWDGVMEPAVEAPPGLIMPRSGFGLAWVIQGFDDVLGFATSGEEVVSGHYVAWQDGWELFIGGDDALVLQLSGSDEWTRPAPTPDPPSEPEPEPVIPIPMPEPRPGGWVYLRELKKCVNLDYVAWIDADSLRIGQYDAVLALPEKTGEELLAYVKTRCEVII